MKKNYAAMLLAVIPGFFAGCATDKDASDAPRPGSGIAEYRQITTESLAEVSAAIYSLDKVSAQAGHCPPKVVSAFARQVDRLQVNSIRVRARAQAIRARGDAYFATWSESIARIKDPRVRELAERHHPELEQSFSRIKLASQEAGEAFKPFLNGLRELRIELEKGPDAAESQSNRDMIRTTRERGQQTVEKLVAISKELQNITSMLTPAKPASR